MQLEQGQRLLVTEDTQPFLPDGYNWIGSAPIIDWFNEIEVYVKQIGYPYRFMISPAEALKMRQAFIDKFGQGSD